MLTQRAPFETASPQDRVYRLLAANRADIFWQANMEAEEGKDIFSADFKDLFEKMTAFNPANRPSIDEIQAHPWMQQGLPHVEEIRADFKRRKATVDLEALAKREEKREMRLKAKTER